MVKRKELVVQLNKVLFKNIWDVIFSTGVLGLFRLGAKEHIIDIVRFDENELRAINSYDDYDIWHTLHVSYFHKKLIPLFKENQKIDSNNPYTYTTRIFNQYIKLYILQMVITDPITYRKFVEYAHPIFSNKFLKALVTETNSISEINPELYHDYVGLYRLLRRNPISDDQANNTITLIDGIDI